jgi:hypothetical protein
MIYAKLRESQYDLWRFCVKKTVFKIISGFINETTNSFGNIFTSQQIKYYDKRAN